MEGTKVIDTHKGGPTHSLPPKRSAKRVARPAARVDASLERPPGKMKRKVFERELEKLHIELVKLQLWVKHKGLRVIVVFEGRDAAGKGGVIKCLTERVSPRVFRVVALRLTFEKTGNGSRVYAGFREGFDRASCRCEALYRVSQMRGEFADRADGRGLRGARATFDRGDRIIR